MSHPVDVQFTIKDVPHSHLVAIGDSVCRGYLLDNPSVESWPSLVASRVGVTIHNYAQNGRGWLEGTPNYGTQLDQANYDRSFDNRAVSLVVFSGSINDDPAKIDAIGDAVVDDCSRAHEAFPNARIYVLSGLQGGQTRNINKPITLMQPLYNRIAVSAAQAGCCVNSTPYAWLGGGIDDTFDGTHPNAEGHRVIAETFLSTVFGMPTGYHLASRDVDFNSPNYGSNPYIGPAGASNTDNHSESAWIIDNQWFLKLHAQFQLTGPVIDRYSRNVGGRQVMTIPLWKLRTGFASAKGHSHACLGTTEGYPVTTLLMTGSLEDTAPNAVMLGRWIKPDGSAFVEGTELALSTDFNMPVFGYINP